MKVTRQKKQKKNKQQQILSPSLAARALQPGGRESEGKS